MIIYRKYGFRYCEVWFDELPTKGVDIVIWRQRKKPLANSNNKPFPTLLIDLSQPSEDLLSGIKKNTRYEMRRAQNSDKCIAEYMQHPDLMLESFVLFYNKFAQQKNLPNLDFAKLTCMSKSGSLVLTRVVCGEETLVWHAYCCIMKRARLLYSASIFRGLDSAQRNLVGRANRYLHWQDILTFQSHGFETYDFGGWSPPDAGDSEKQKINKFKEEFGGVKVVEFDCVKPESLLGKFVLVVKKILID